MGTCPLALLGPSLPPTWFTKASATIDTGTAASGGFRQVRFTQLYKLVVYLKTGTIL